MGGNPLPNAKKLQLPIYSEKKLISHCSSESRSEGVYTIATSIEDKGGIWIFSGYKWKFAELDNSKKISASFFEGFSSISICFSTFPSSDLSVGNLWRGFSSEIKFRSYQISPKFSFIKEIEPFSLKELKGVKYKE